jgi:hypothetical protein
MKSILAILISLILVSCNNSTETKGINKFKIKENSIDTILVKVENKIDKSYEIGFYEKSFTYYWVTKKDTLDFKIELTEYVRDSSIQLRISHRNPILFSKALAKINNCLPLIEQDFNLQNLTSLYLEAPIFYKDLISKLSKNYKNQFGEKNINYKDINKFLRNSWLDEKLRSFLKQLDKSTTRYRIEKFHLISKENYGEYIPNENLNDYPLFSIHGMGILVNLNKNE